MNLHIAGITHFNPLHRGRLEDWFHEKRLAGLGEPLFIATEWDQAMFARLQNQRSEFRELLQAEWPGVSEHLLKTLTLSLAYEGDAHLSEYPDAALLWLDDGRIPDEGDLENYLPDRLALYREYVDGADVGNEAAFLEALSRNAERRAAAAGFVPGRRDSVFAHRILGRIEVGAERWAAVIVGKFHGSEVPGSMRMQLQQHGVPCEVTCL